MIVAVGESVAQLRARIDDLEQRVHFLTGQRDGARRNADQYQRQYLLYRQLRQDMRRNRDLWRHRALEARRLLDGSAD